MRIELLQTMQWSKLCWDQSFAEVIELDTLLPKVGQNYPIVLGRNEDFALEGLAFILWLPPHSELNGWWDKRPSEILQSYVIEGELTNRRENWEARELYFDFRVISLQKLVDSFPSCIVQDSLSNQSPLPYLGQDAVSSWLGWKSTWQIDNSWRFEKYELDDYIYLMSSGSEYMSEAILSYKEDALYLHYSADLPSIGSYSTIITKYRLTHKEQVLLQQILPKATTLMDTSSEVLTANQIRGADYW